MSDQDQSPPTLQSRLLAFATGPQGQSLIRRALSGSGIAGVWLVHLGFPQADLGPLSDFIIVILPFVLAEVWAQFTKTKAAIVSQAAKIVADRQGAMASPAGEKAAGELVKAVGTLPGVAIGVDTSASSEAIAAVAHDPSAPNVNPI